MAKQTFTTGSVLTATQMNDLQTNDFNQTVSQKTASYVLVAADKGTRIEMNAAGATTVTVNTGLFNAGDTLFIQNIGAGACTVTAGTATVNKATAGSLTLSQYQGGTLYFVSASSAIFFADAGYTPPLTTKGDLFTYSTDNTRLAVGTNGQYLSADSTATTGLKWASVTTQKSYSLINSPSGTALSGASTTVSGISNIDSILVVIIGMSSASAGSLFNLQINADTGANNLYGGGATTAASTYAAANIFESQSSTAATSIPIYKMSTDAGSVGNVSIWINGCNTTGVKTFTLMSGGNANGGTDYRPYYIGGIWNNTSTVSSLKFNSGTGNFDAGTVYVYGAS